MARTKFNNFWRLGEITHGPNQLRVVILVPETPTQCSLQPDSFVKIAQRVQELWSAQ